MKKLTIVTILLFTAIFSKAQWIQQYAEIPDTVSINDIFFLDENNGWIVGGKDELFSNGSFYGMRTTDGGETWEIMPVFQDFSANSVFFIDEEKGWIGGSYHVTYTTDGGTSWTEAGNIFNDYIINDIFFIDDSTGFITGSSFGIPESHATIFRTMDGGDTWEIIGGGVGFLLGADFINDSTGWSSFVKDGFYGIEGVFFTSDGGNNWLKLTGDLAGKLCFYDESTGWLMGALNLAGQLYKTTDGGANWEPQLGDTISGIADVYCMNQNEVFAVGYDGTIIHTTDGGENWDYQESPVSTNFYKIVFVDENNGWILGDSATILHTNNGGFVGTNEIVETTMNVKIYPNPVKDYAHISLPSVHSCIQVSLCDISGRILKSKEIKAVQNENVNLDFYMGDLTPGLYVLKLLAGNRMYSRKIIKQ